ncbi:MAG: lytic transglycosylase domain-containing protein [Acidobacteriota bacterium]
MSDRGELPVSLMVAGSGGAKGVLETAAVAAAGAASAENTVVLFRVGAGRLRPATVFSTGPAKAVEALLNAGFPEVKARARGRIVVACLPDDSTAAGLLADSVELLPAGTGLVVAAAPGRYRELIESDRCRFRAVAIRADGDGDPGDDPLLSLVVAEAEVRVERVDLVRGGPGRLAARRALAGSGRPSDSFGLRAPKWLSGNRGQATPLVLGGVFALIVGALVLVAIAGAITGKARAQRAVDLAAMSAAGSMRDDLPRLMAPATLPNGLPNPAHISKAVYLFRARLAAVRFAVANGASPLTVSVSFPDRLSFAPLRARVAVRTTVESGGDARPAPESWAEARVGARLSMGAVPAMATGGGHGGPLAERQGKGMRPDVAAAFDRMAAAAGAAGISLSVNSAFRSDAEQAALFAANPDPTWVARPGTSLHRCATELDLGPPSAYRWLATHASRFGFVQRYSWEPWHFGLAAGPAPCSEAGDRVAGGGADPSRSSSGTLPGFVPDRYRRTILAAAVKWNVSATLIAAQLLAESDFDPRAVSSAGARGIAQFMPGTAAAYGLADPFDPVAAIGAQAHLMSDLLKRFGSPALALAAYNAGPGAVAPCDCVPDYPETRAYVARILALLGGAGAIAPMAMDIALVK